MKTRWIVAAGAALVFSTGGAAQAETPPALPATAAAAPPVDALPSPGYLPGYRTYQGLSLSPHAPRGGALPGGVTASYGAPMPLEQWTFRFSGSLSASLQESVGQRASAAPGQGTSFLRAPPQTIDEYASFVGTTTMPGHWASLSFVYAKPRVGVNLALNTWNPTAPTTYYQIGGQLFINYFHLRYDLAPIGPLAVRVLLGYFPAYFGSLGQYGPGMYTNQLVGVARGVGEDVAVEYPLGPDLRLLFEQGFVGSRNGKVPDGVPSTGGNGGNNPNNPIFPAAWVNHLHLGLLRAGEPTVKVMLHYMTNWAHDDRTQMPVDNKVTRQLDEAHVRDGRIDVLGIDASLNHRTWGYLGVGGSYVKGENAFTLKGLSTFGNEGIPLTERWWGQATGGTGKLFAAGVNYSASVARILARAQALGGEKPDVIVNAGLVVAYTLTRTPLPQGTTVATTVATPVAAGTSPPVALPADVDIFNHRLRYKAGVDALCTFLSFLAAGVRVDRVAPTSKDAGETFHVVAARVVLKSNWSSRDNVTILYGKWFYGPRSHPETSSIVASDTGRLDDQLIAINANLSW